MYYFLGHELEPLDFRRRTLTSYLFRQVLFTTEYFTFTYANKVFKMDMSVGNVQIE